MRPLEFIFFIILVIGIASCKQEKKFSEEGWKKSGDLGFYPERVAMVKDLITSHQLKGLQIVEIRNKLGPPNFIRSVDNTFTYEISTYYRRLDIDPTGTLALVLSFNNDSIVTRYEIVKSGHE